MCGRSVLRFLRNCGAAGRWTVFGTVGAGFWGILFLGLIGCGPRGPELPTTHLEGMVRLDGQPIPEGFISFIPQGRKQAPPVKAEIRDGRYSAQKVPIGPVLVMIRAPKKTGKIETIPHSQSQYEEVVETVPRKYLTGIPLEITDSLKTHDFDLSSQ